MKAFNYGQSSIGLSPYHIPIMSLSFHLMMSRPAILKICLLLQHDFKVMVIQELKSSKSGFFEDF